MSCELNQKNAIARANEVGPMRFRSYWGPSSTVFEYGLLFEKLNTGELQGSGRITSSAGDDITHTPTQGGIKLFT